ncbi:hypothetical protein P8452_43403 [Trifolium repens]|nr:hypothetical protein P8452_43403 [Trifolium repens]
MTIIYAGETIQHSISNLVEDKVDYNNQELCRRFNLLMEVIAFFKCLDKDDCPEVPNEKTFIYECINYICELFLLESVPMVPIPLIE